MHPLQQCIGVPDGRGQPDALQSVTGKSLKSLEDGQQVPAAVVPGERMQFIDDDDAKVREQHPVVDVGRHEHRLERLRRGEEHVRRLCEQAVPLARGGVAMPQPHASPHPRCVAGQTRLEVVEQRPQWRDVEDGKPLPLPLGHRRQQREEGGLGLAARSGRQEQAVVAAADRLDGLTLKGPQV